MKTEIQIRTTQQCPDCKGEGEVYNPEWEGYTENEKAFKAANPSATPGEVNRAGDDYWEAKGYSRSYLKGPSGIRSAEEYYVPGPWDVRDCENCDGSGTETRLKWVDAQELIEAVVAKAIT